MSLDRRRFVRLSAVASGALALDPSWLEGLEGLEGLERLDRSDRSDRSDRGGAGGHAPGRIAVVGATEETEYGRGAILGIEEAGRSAELLRRDPLIVRLPVAAVGDGDMTAWVGDLVARGIIATVSALGQGQAAFERAAVAGGLVLMDARADWAGGFHASEPDSSTPRVVFRTGLPARAYDLALRRVLTARRVGIRSEAASEERAVLWHADLFRYGAEQLNERYRRRFGRGMTGEAWAAWMAVKAVGEAMLRSRTGEREQLLDLLGGHRAAFDGHKGVPLSFSAPDGTLAQPFYVISETGTTEFFWPMEEATDGG